MQKTSNEFLTIDTQFNSGKMNVDFDGQGGHDSHVGFNGLYGHNNHIGFNGLYSHNSHKCRF